MFRNISSPAVTLESTSHFQTRHLHTPSMFNNLLASTHYDDTAWHRWQERGSGCVWCMLGPVGGAQAYPTSSAPHTGSVAKTCARPHTALPGLIFNTKVEKIQRSTLNTQALAPSLRSPNPPTERNPKREAAKWQTSGCF